MSVNLHSFDEMLDRIKLLPPEYRLRLMQEILESLLPDADKTRSAEILRYGEYKDFNGPMSTLEDYAIAEWRPTSRSMNGE